MTQSTIVTDHIDTHTRHVILYYVTDPINVQPAIFLPFLERTHEGLRRKYST